jgi:metal-responsive CopG/Arc/MetJ family transcriptional regulator
MPGLVRETRLQIMLEDRELEKIDTWRFKQRMPSRAAAIRRLLQIALDAETTGVADPSRNSASFGVFAHSQDEAKAQK